MSDCNLEFNKTSEVTKVPASCGDCVECVDFCGHTACDSALQFYNCNYGLQLFYKSLTDTQQLLFFDCVIAGDLKMLRLLAYK